jgi:hypothetical protein
MRECRFHLDASARTVAPFMPARDENQACGGSISVPLQCWVCRKAALSVDAHAVAADKEIAAAVQLLLGRANG